ncbi:MAG: winged helix-turn-helix domain-containing protein, partial [Myxococcota bacterium]
GRWGTEIVRKNGKLADDVIAAVAELGPSTAGQIEAHLASEPRGRKGPWWDRSDTKWVAEALFASGVLTTATRVGFARHYDLTENVLPPDVVARDVDDEDAVRELVLRAATALGVATETDIRDYFRLGAKQAKPAIAELVSSGEIEEVAVDGWTAPGYLRVGQSVPRQDRGTALLCPFDPLIFFRPRVERIFGFHYRIEIYTPAPKRRYGYYVWPFLLDGRLVGRVDLKADRTRSDESSVLNVVGAFTEPGESSSRVAQALALELQSMASWLGLSEVTVGERGDLAPALSRALRRLGMAPVS